MFQFTALVFVITFGLVVTVLVLREFDLLTAGAGFIVGIGLVVASLLYDAYLVVDDFLLAGGMLAILIGTVSLLSPRRHLDWHGLGLALVRAFLVAGGVLVGLFRLLRAAVGPVATPAPVVRRRRAASAAMPTTGSKPAVRGGVRHRYRLAPSGPANHDPLLPSLPRALSRADAVPDETRATQPTRFAGVRAPNSATGDSPAGNAVAEDGLTAETSADAGLAVDLFAADAFAANTGADESPDDEPIDDDDEDRQVALEISRSRWGPDPELEGLSLRMSRLPADPPRPGYLTRLARRH
ncbi:MAG: hypothetical protein GC191_03060 [Azospirillum sp.]|nr:hypothetical protein [Azospirillum sp.]